MVPQVGVTVYTCVAESGAGAVLVVSNARATCPPPTDHGAGKNQYLHTATMPFSLKEHEHSVVLRIVQEGKIVEAFAQGGRANVALWPQDGTALREGRQSSPCAKLVASSAMDGWSTDFGHPAAELAFRDDNLAAP